MSSLFPLKQQKRSACPMKYYARFDMGSLLNALHIQPLTKHLAVHLQLLPGREESVQSSFTRGLKSKLLCVSGNRWECWLCARIWRSCGKGTSYFLKIKKPFGKKQIIKKNTYECRSWSEISWVLSNLTSLFLLLHPSLPTIVHRDQAQFLTWRWRLVQVWLLRYKQTSFDVRSCSLS